MVDPMYIIAAVLFLVMTIGTAVVVRKYMGDGSSSSGGSQTRRRKRSKGARRED